MYPNSISKMGHSPSQLVFPITSANSKGMERRNMDVSKNRGIPKSSILIGFSIINHPFWGTPIFGNTHIGIGFNMFLIH